MPAVTAAFFTLVMVQEKQNQKRMGKGEEGHKMARNVALLTSRQRQSKVTLDAFL